MSGALLLTGPTGVLGSALRDELGRAPAHEFDEIVCLVHSQGLSDQTRSLRGDVTAPNLGLKPEVWNELRSQVTCVVHSAALTAFGADGADIHAVNVEGTKRIVDFAEAAEARLLHVSTAAIRGVGEGDGGPLDPGAYVASKRQAEDVVCASGLDSVLLRPSLVIGDSSSGEIASFQGIHMLARFVLEGSLPVLPIGPGDLVDLIPQDIVASAIRHVLVQGAPARELWLTTGADALTVDRALTLTAEYAEGIGLDVELPELVDPASIPALSDPAVLDGMPRRERGRFEQMISLLAPLATAEPLPSDLSLLAEHGWDGTLDLEDAFRANLRYLGERKSLARRQRA